MPVSGMASFSKKASAMSSASATGNHAVPLAPVAALLLGAVAMGVSPIFVRLATVGPFTSAFWRIALALPPLWLWMIVAERRAGERRAERSFSPATLLAGAAFTGDLVCWHLAIVRTTVANATFFATTAPVWVVIFGWLLFNARVTAAVLVGIGVCILGGLFLVAESLQAGLAHVTGDLLAVVAGVFFGLLFLALSAARRTAGAARVTFEAGLVTGAALFLIAWMEGGSLLPATAEGWWPLVGLGWISQLCGQGLLSVAIGRLPAVFSSLVVFLEAVVAAVFGWLVLGEAVSLIQALGGITIVLGIWIARPHPASSPPS